MKRLSQIQIATWSARRRTSRGVAAVLASSLALSALAVLPAAASSALVTEDLSGPLTADDLAQSLAGAGVVISNVVFNGPDTAGGTFTGGGDIIGIDDGVILSSGNIANVVGPNVQDGITTSHGTPGDSDLSALTGNPTNDAAVLEFDFVPNKDSVFVQYVFSSDEYNEFVNSSFDDVFAFFVNGVNCATVDGDRVSINTINNGNPFGSSPSSHPELYINNDLSDGGGSINTEMDGLTVGLTCEAPVNPDTTNHMKLAIADTSDSVLDSNVFLQAGTLSTDPPVNNPPDCSQVSAEPNSLWPPNHKFQLVTLTGESDPDGDPVTLSITGVSQDEPVDGVGDGNTAADAKLGEGDADQSNEVLLRAERSGSGDGRVYTVSFTVTDGDGASCSGTVTVGVPHDQDGGPAVDSGDTFNSLSPTSSPEAKGAARPKTT